jgi:hypothetical protein
VEDDNTPTTGDKLVISVELNVDPLIEVENAVNAITDNLPASSKMPNIVLGSMKENRSQRKAINPGYIYVLTNSSAQGIVKIGKTQRDPNDRAKELSSATGVPTPFVVVYQCEFQDCYKAELFIHSKLERYRVSSNREFFQLPINIAVDTILEAKNMLDKSRNTFDILNDSDNSDGDSLGIDDILDSLTIGDKQDPGNEMFEAADAYYYGLGDTIQDYEEAFNLYQKAARLGSAEAFLQMGIMCRDGEGRSADNKRALEFFKEGIRHGNDECWAEMAKIYFSEGHKSNEDKCWNKYFTSEQYSKFGLNRNICVLTYVENKIEQNSPIEHKDQIREIKKEVLELINRLAKSTKEHGRSQLVEERMIEHYRKTFIVIKEL